MKIAKHLFKFNDSVGKEKKTVSVQKALRIIRDFNVLKVEDLLDLFPESAEVSEMKEHLC